MLIEIFGDYPQVRIIDLLISHPWSEYTKKEMAECANVSRTTLYKFFEELEKYGLVKPTRKIGNTQLYTVNMESTTTKAISAFQMRLADIEIEKEMELHEKEEISETVSEAASNQREEHITLFETPFGGSEGVPIAARGYPAVTVTGSTAPPVFYPSKRKMSSLEIRSRHIEIPSSEVSLHGKEE